MGWTGAVGGLGAAGGATGHSHFVIDGADLAAIREVRTAAAARISEMRQELEAAEAELAVIDEALQENAREADLAATEENAGDGTELA